MQISTADIAAQLGRMDLLSAVPEALLLRLAGACQIRSLQAEAVVFEKGEPGNALFLILEGGVRVHDGDFTVAKVETGNCFGEMALLDEGERSMSVSATVSTTLACIEREVFFDVLGQHPGIMQSIVGLLTRRLRDQTDRTLEQLRRREEELTRLVEVRTAELRQQKEEADRQRLRAEQSEQAEQMFLANMSHEIRTPMNAVMGMTNLLLQKNPREEQLRYLHSIRQSSETLLVILNDILDLSKIQAGQLELEYTELDVAALIRHLQTLLLLRAEEKGLLLSVRIDPAIPPVVFCDPVRLQQVLFNLTGNALKFTEKGSVSLRTDLLDKSDERCRIRFEVRDTGIGMSPEQQQIVFDSFRQAASDTTRKYGGTGLGLTISKQLVERFGSTLQLSSQPGEGSVFWFELDLEIGKAAPRLRTADHETLPELKGLRILLAEDNELNRIVAEETLEMLIPDLQLTVVGDGQEALEAFQSDSFDLVLMDVNMPVMNGYEATQQIRRLPTEQSKVPVLAFTASVTRQEIRQCMESGMNGCIPKPFRREELLQAIQDALSPAQTPASAPTPKAAPSYIEQLAGDNPERLFRYLGLFLDSARTALPRLGAALAAADREELRRVVHTLNPQFRMLGMTDAAKLAQEIEMAVLDGTQLEQIAPRVESIIEMLGDSIREVEDRLR